MSRTFTFEADEYDDEQRIDTVLSFHDAYNSRSAAAKYCMQGLVRVNGETVTKKHLVHAGDIVEYEVEEEIEYPVVGQDIPLDIRYEDDDIIVLSKQAGLICHPSVDHYDGTLVNALIFHCGHENLCNVQGEDDRLGIVHRLDMDTTGLMLAAKTNEAGLALMEGIQARAIDRRYLALVHGNIAPDTGLIDAPIARHAQDRLRMAIRDVPSAREALTTFTVLERFEAGVKDDGYTLIECKLYTGRTHQIRVHMEYARHPLVGDPLYTTHAPKAPQSNLGLTRQFLHSYSLGLDHPITGAHLEFCDQLPTDLQECLDALSDRSRGRTDAGREILERMEEAPKPSLEAFAGY